MFEINSKMFTTREEDFNREMADLNAKFEDLKATDLEYYTIVTGSWVNAVNNLLEDPLIPESLKIRIGRILEILNK